MRVDVWSDMVCPWCRIGKARLEQALARAGVQAEVVFHAFELDPSPRASGPLLDELARKFGSPERVRAAWARVEQAGAPDGLRFDFARAVGANTFDAHRLALHAQGQERGAPMVERLMRAHFEEGLDLADRATLARLAEEVGVVGAAAMLSSGAFEAEARADERAARSLGIGGVPFFVFDGKLAVSGAQPVELFEQAIAQALREPQTA